MTKDEQEPAIEEILDEGRRNPLPPDESSSLLAALAARLQDTALARGDIEAARACEELLPGRPTHEDLIRRGERP